ncbi:MAG: hypothetical protein LIO37_01815 [Clostridiales bacterium]|nr:hypothetical protein [Clostridiales bacterium]
MKMNEKNFPLQTASGRDERYVRELGGDWRFGGRGMAPADALAADTAAWEKVTIPHTWNASDAEDGDNYYDRNSYWYCREFAMDECTDGKRVYVEFTGANTKTTVYVNGQQAGPPHLGGYTAFRYDITDYLTDKGSNILHVCVDNTLDQDIAPISADFNMYGGIYRRVFLIVVDEVHMDLDSHGASGLYLTTGNMRSMTQPRDLGQFTLRTKLVNSSDEAKALKAVTTIIGDNAPQPYVQEVIIAAKGELDFTERCEVENPTLWMPVHCVLNKEISQKETKYAGTDYHCPDNVNSINDSKKLSERLNEAAAYQYDVVFSLYCENQLLDEVTEHIGFRYFYVDKENGFYINGQPYPLRGVNRHSFLAGVGNALTEEDHMRDMQIMLELGCSCVRLCHYPQTDYFYDLCDRYGIIVWSEIPLVNRIGEGRNFSDVTKEQLTELICQQYHRPSVIFWGLENEIGNGQSQTNPLDNPCLAGAKRLVYELHQLAHELDTTGRYTVQAVNRDYAMNQGDAAAMDTDFENNIGWKSDLIAWNIYPRWYDDPNFAGTFEEVMNRKRAMDTRCMAISEYGWGANPGQHEAHPELENQDAVNGNTDGKVTASGAWHPEEYQNLRNEEAIAYINENNGLWATFYWSLFDFAVDARNEGSRPALNDKGLVTDDRLIKKDSYYLYKANWNHTEPFVYITSRRWNVRPAGETYIKVYSNCDNVELFVDGESLGIMESKGNGIFIKEDVLLRNCRHRIEGQGNHAECNSVEMILFN